MKELLEYLALKFKGTVSRIVKYIEQCNHDSRYSKKCKGENHVFPIHRNTYGNIYGGKPEDLCQCKKHTFSDVIKDRREKLAKRIFDMQMNSRR